MRGCNSSRKNLDPPICDEKHLYYPNVSDKKRSGSELLNDEWDNTIFFPSNKESYTKTSNSPFFQSKLLQRRHSWYKFTGKSWTGLIYAVERLANQKHQISNGACVLMCAVGEKDFGFWQEMFTAMFTNKKDDIRGDWGSDYWWQHLWNAWDIDVRTVKPRRIPLAPSQ